MGLQGRLEEAGVELRHTKAEVADLREMVDKGRQDREELKTVRNQLVIATRDLSGARKVKESLEVCYRSVRGMSSSMYAVLCLLL